MRHRLLPSLLAAAAALCGTAAAEDMLPANAEFQVKPTPYIKQEKCYGISRAHANDCANATGTHGCAGYAAKDNVPADWVMVPAGTCTKLVGGMLEPKL